MATTIRRIIQACSWVLVTVIASLPVFGIVVALWPTMPIAWTDITQFFSYNGLLISFLNSLLVAVLAPLLGFYIAFMVYTQYRFHQKWQQLEQRLAPLLSLPHLAVALGLVYLFGGGAGIWAVLNEWLNISLPAWLGLPRKSLVTVVIAITIKEVPFFLLVLSAIGRQLPIKEWLLQGRALGYSPALSWWLLILPPIMKQSRLALLAAMAYCLSVLDISLLVGPNVPPLYAVVLYGWQTGFSALEQTHAYLGNILLLFMLALLVLAIYVHEWLATKRLKTAAIMGNALLIARANRFFVVWLSFFTMLSVAILLTFFLWSLGWGKQTVNLSFNLWAEEWFFVKTPLLNSLYIALISSTCGVLISLIALELQRQRQYYFPDYIWLMAILLPQLSMVYGWQLTHTQISASYHVSWVIMSHLPFTFAYSYLVLKGPFQSLDKRYELVAASLGYSYWQRWWKIRFNLLRPATLSALAITFSVSIAQYVPTLVMGAGRTATITTETVAIASGNEQNITAIYMLLQAMLPFFAFLIASVLAYRFRGSFDATNH